LEAVDALEQGQPGVLDDVLGDLAIGDMGAGDREHRRAVPVDEIDESALVTCPQRVDYLVVDGGHQAPHDLRGTPY
jgi:hypothetical protein